MSHASGSVPSSSLSSAAVSSSSFTAKWLAMPQSQRTALPLHEAFPSSARRGAGQKTEQHPPQPQPQLPTFVDVVGGEGGFAAITDKGHVYLWGPIMNIVSDSGSASTLTSAHASQAAIVRNFQAEDNEERDPMFNVAFSQRLSVIAFTITAVAVGREHLLLLTHDGFVLSGGSNNYGQLGQGDLSQRPQPRHVEMLQGVRVVHVAAGTYSSLCLDSTGALWAFGRNNNGCLGVGDREENKPFPTRTVHPRPLRHVSMAEGRLLAVSTCGLIYHVGELRAFGVDSSKAVGVPRWIPCNVRMTQCVALPHANYFLSNAGQVYAMGRGSWGGSSYGSLLGLGYVADVNVTHPTLLQGALRGVTVCGIAGGVDTCYAWDAQGRVYGWGRGALGGLGPFPKIYHSEAPVRSCANYVDAATLARVTSLTTSSVNVGDANANANADVDASADADAKETVSVTPLSSSSPLHPSSWLGNGLLARRMLKSSTDETPVSSARDAPLVLQSGALAPVPVRALHRPRKGAKLLEPEAKENIKVDDAWRQRERRLTIALLPHEDREYLPCAKIAVAMINGRNRQLSMIGYPSHRPILSVEEGKMSSVSTVAPLPFIEVSPTTVAVKGPITVRFYVPHYCYGDSLVVIKHGESRNSHVNDHHLTPVSTSSAVSSVNAPSPAPKPVKPVAGEELGVVTVNVLAPGYAGRYVMCYTIEGSTAKIMTAEFTVTK